MRIPGRVGIKLGLLISLLMIGMAITLSWYFLTSSSRLLREELVKRGVEITRNLSRTAVDGILTENLFHELDPLIEATMLNHDIAFVAILDKHGKILAHTKPKEMGKGAQPNQCTICHPAHVNTSSKKMSQVYKELIKSSSLSRDPVCLGEVKEKILFGGAVTTGSGQGSLVEKSQGLDTGESGVVGTILLGISMKTLSAETANIIKVSLWIILLSIAIGIALSFFFSTRITAPIRVLTHSMEDICSGKLDVVIDPEIGKSRDEIGSMANSFNRMKDNIQQLINALKESNLELERRVDERTFEVKQKAVLLEKTVEELTRVNQELDSFVYTASHDLKEPLRAIETFSNFILEDYWERLDDDGRDYLKRISAGAYRLKSLIDALLVYSRTTRGKAEYLAIDLSHIIREALKRLEHTIKERHVKLRVRSDIPVIYGDSTKLVEVFYNLISNAIKYNDKEHPVVEIDCPIPQPSDDEVIVYVKDNGIGIDEASYDEVFKIFRRLHARDEHGGGTGAGLAIVKKILDEHKARIWIESRVGEGTAFYLSFPKEGTKGQRDS